MCVRVRACVRACVFLSVCTRVRACVHACVRACMCACVVAMYKKIPLPTYITLLVWAKHTWPVTHEDRGCS